MPFVPDTFLSTAIVCADCPLGPSVYGDGPTHHVHGDGQKPDEDDEQEKGRIVVGVLRPDDDWMDADEGLNHRENDEQRCQDL